MKKIRGLQAKPWTQKHVDPAKTEASKTLRNRRVPLAQLVANERHNLGAAIRLQGEIARLRSALASASCDLAGGDARAAMVRAAIDLALAVVPS